MPNALARVIRVSAVVLRDSRGRVLTVRKRGTARFMLPGGKPEPGESPEETAIRECLEETGVSLAPESTRYLGLFRADAANEPGYTVEAAVYVVDTPVTNPEPSQEIAEIRWLDLSTRLPDDLAPMLEHQVLPRL